MRFVSIEKYKNGEPVIVTETPRFLRKPKIRKFISKFQLTENHWRWLELPNNSEIMYYESLQLDDWYKTYIYLNNE